MPTYITGNLWDAIGSAHLLLVTTNSTLRQDGCLVMGRGAALEAKTFYPTLAADLGARIAAIPYGQRRIYGILQSSISDQGTFLGAFQVKHHWKDNADLAIIAYSAGMLCAMAQKTNLIFAMNYPGIGFGHLLISEVKPYLGPLPANVHIYRREP